MLSTDCELEVALERPNGVFQAGELVRGFVGVRVGKAVKVRELKVKLGWRTHGSGRVNKGEVDSARLFSGDWAEGAADLYPFELRIPAGPLTFRSEHLNLDWYVTANADVPWAFDPSGEHEIEVGRPQAPQRLDLGPLPAHQEPATGVGGSVFAAVFGLFFVGFSLIFHAVMLPMALMSFADGEIFSGLFFLAFELIPALFTVIGGVMVVAAVREARARRRLGSSTFTVPNRATPGEALPVRFQFTPRANVNLQTVRLRLVGEAETQSGSGTNTRTWRDVLLSEDIPFGMRGALSAGVPVAWEASLPVPDGAPPTFTATQNRVSWLAELELQEPGGVAVTWRQYFTVDR